MSTKAGYPLVKAASLAALPPGLATCWAGQRMEQGKLSSARASLSTETEMRGWRHSRLRMLGGIKFSWSNVWSTVLASVKLLRINVRCIDSLFIVLLCTTLFSPPSHAQSPPEVELPGGLGVVAAIEQASMSAIERAESSVVAITRIRKDQQPSSRLDWLEKNVPFSFESAPDQADYIPAFYGSGVIISDDGYIVTCGHVIGDPRRNDYYVWLAGESYSANVVASSSDNAQQKKQAPRRQAQSATVYAMDPFSDLAVMKISKQGLRPIQFGSPDTLRKGQFVIALGNPQAIARDGEASASWGIVSNLNRLAPREDNAESAVSKESIHEFGTLIQTDVRLTRGSSGGALINLRGEMVGLTTALVAISGQEQSAGFAIAVDEMFKRVLESLKQGQLPEYGFLGIQPEDLRRVDRERGMHGARVSVVIPGLPGDQAGLKADDIIVQVGEVNIDDRNDLFRELSRLPAGEEVPLLVQRAQVGNRRPRMIRLSARLSKKYVATSRPGYAIKGPELWRGMLVEYATAVPSELMRAGSFMGSRNAPKVAVLSVEPNTPAWNAGIRPGDGVLSVNGRSVDSPDDFQREVAGNHQELRVVIVKNGRGVQSLQVPAASGEEPQAGRID